MFAEERNQKNIQSDETEKKPFIQINHIRKVFTMGTEKVVALDDTH